MTSTTTAAATFAPPAALSLVPSTGNWTCESSHKVFDQAWAFVPATVFLLFALAGLLALLAPKTIFKNKCNDPSLVLARVFLVGYTALDSIGLALLPFTNDVPLQIFNGANILRILFEVIIVVVVVPNATLDHSYADLGHVYAWSGLIVALVTLLGLQTVSFLPQYIDVTVEHELTGGILIGSGCARILLAICLVIVGAYSLRATTVARAAKTQSLPALSSLQVWGQAATLVHEQEHAATWSRQLPIDDDAGTTCGWLSACPSIRRFLVSCQFGHARISWTALFIIPWVAFRSGVEQLCQLSTLCCGALLACFKSIKRSNIFSFGSGIFGHHLHGALWYRQLVFTYLFFAVALGLRSFYDIWLGTMILHHQHYDRFWRTNNFAIAVFVLDFGPSFYFLSVSFSDGTASRTLHRLSHAFYLVPIGLFFVVIATLLCLTEVAVDCSGTLPGAVAAAKILARCGVAVIWVMVPAVFISMQYGALSLAEATSFGMFLPRQHGSVVPLHAVFAFLLLCGVLIHLVGHFQLRALYNELSSTQLQRIPASLLNYMKSSQRLDTVGTAYAWVTGIIATAFFSLVILVGVFVGNRASTVFSYCHRMASYFFLLVAIIHGAAQVLASPLLYMITLVFVGPFIIMERYSQLCYRRNSKTAQIICLETEKMKGTPAAASAVSADGPLLSKERNYLEQIVILRVTVDVQASIFGYTLDALNFNVRAGQWLWIRVHNLPDAALAAQWHPFTIARYSMSRSEEKPPELTLEFHISLPGAWTRALRSMVPEKSSNEFSNLWNAPYVELWGSYSSELASRDLFTLSTPTLGLGAGVGAAAFVCYATQYLQLLQAQADHHDEISKMRAEIAKTEQELWAATRGQIPEPVAVAGAGDLVTSAEELCEEVKRMLPSMVNKGKQAVSDTKSSLQEASLQINREAGQVMHKLENMKKADAATVSDDDLGALHTDVSNCANRLDTVMVTWLADAKTSLRDTVASWTRPEDQFAVAHLQYAISWLEDRIAVQSDFARGFAPLLAQKRRGEISLAEYCQQSQKLLTSARQAADSALSLMDQAAAEMVDEALFWRTVDLVDLQRPMNNMIAAIQELARKASALLESSKTANEQVREQMKTMTENIQERFATVRPLTFDFAGTIEEWRRQVAMAARAELGVLAAEFVLSGMKRTLSAMLTAFQPVLVKADVMYRAKETAFQLVQGLESECSRDRARAKDELLLSHSTVPSLWTTAVSFDEAEQIHSAARDVKRRAEAEFEEAKTFRRKIMKVNDMLKTHVENWNAAITNLTVQVDNGLRTVVDTQEDLLTMIRLVRGISSEYNTDQLVPASEAAGAFYTEAHKRESQRKKWSNLLQKKNKAIARLEQIAAQVTENGLGSGTNNRILFTLNGGKDGQYGRYLGRDLKLDSLGGVVSYWGNQGETGRLKMKEAIIRILTGPNVRTLAICAGQKFVDTVYEYLDEANSSHSRFVMPTMFVEAFG